MSPTRRQRLWAQSLTAGLTVAAVWCSAAGPVWAQEQPGAAETQAPASDTAPAASETALPADQDDTTPAGPANGGPGAAVFDNGASDGSGQAETASDTTTTPEPAGAYEPDDGSELAGPEDEPARPPARTGPGLGPSTRYGNGNSTGNGRGTGSRGDATFEGYDFGQVVETMQSSVTPLQQEMDRSFKIFMDRVGEAEQLLDDGKTSEAVQMTAAAIEGVLAVREKVLGPMWQGQMALTEQTSKVRARLARAVELSGNGKAGGNGRAPAIDQRAETTLNSVARRIATEKDALRKKRLIAHYRAVRNLARVRAMAEQLSPDQRKLWLNVLQVLDEASLAHQQVLMGSEVLFAQFEATGSNLKEYMGLMDTVEGASRLMKMVRGAREEGTGMAGFVENMGQLQQRLSGFNESVEQALQGRMFNLDAEIDALAPLEGDPGAPGGGTASAVMSTEEDAELHDRIERLQPAEGRPVRGRRATRESRE